MAPTKLTWRTFTTIEPVMLLFAYGLFMGLPTLQQYTYSRISQAKGFPYNPLKEHGCADRNNTLESLEKEVQKAASRFDIGNVMFQSVPSLIMSLFVGPWTDTGGRKAAIVSPVLGVFIDALNAIIVMYLGLPLYVLFVGSAINGFCGFFTIMTQSAMSYIADTTPESKLALRLAIMQLMILVGGLISQLTSGLWITRLGFIAPFWFVFSCELAALMYVIFFVPQSKPQSNKAKVRFFSLDSPKSIWSVYRDPRNGYRRSLLLLLIGDGIVSLATMGLSGVILLFVLRSPLCWSPTVLGYFMAFRFLMQGVGGILGIGLLKRCLSDSNVGRLGLLSLIASLILFAFANVTWVVFLVPLVGILIGTVSPIMKGMISQLTQPDERGAAFSAVAAISTLCNFLGAFLFNPIYIKSLEFDFPGLVFLISAVLTLFPLAIFSFLKNSEYKPPLSEMDASTAEEVKIPELEENQNQKEGDDEKGDVEMTDEPVGDNTSAKDEEFTAL